MSIYSVFSVGMSQTRKLRFPFSVEGFGQGVEKIVPLVGAGLWGPVGSINSGMK